jgi:hypothetical protein
VFAELRNHPGRKAPITADEVIAECPGPQDAVQKEDKGWGALRTLKTELNKRLATFFDGEGQSLPYRMTLPGEGSFTPQFSRNNATEFAPLFWRPYLESDRVTRLMYPEPFFVIDKNATTFRNSAVNKLEDKETLAYLGGPPIGKGKGKIQLGERYVDTLKAGYSYVPAGIVQAMFHVTNCLLRHANHLELQAEALMPADVRPRSPDELILFATPTSVAGIVKYLEGGLRMQTTSEGVRLAGRNPIPETEEGEEFVKWGVVTRKRVLNQTITLISAKHGRAVEAISQELTISKRLAALAEMLQTANGFPLEFQALYSVRMKTTPEGPRPDGTKLEEALPIQSRI